MIYLSFQYLDPILGQRRKPSEYVAITQSVQVNPNGYALLSEIPDMLTRVQILNMFEVNEVPDTGLSVTQYKVDYSMGLVQFHPSMIGETVTVSYSGTGGTYFPASRVWTKSLNGINVDETLDQLLSAADNFNYQGVYDNTKVYYKRNIVSYIGVLYLCIQDTTAGILPTNSTYWVKVAYQSFKNTYSSTTTYNAGDIVNDSTLQKLYICLADGTTNIPLTNTSKWQLIIDVSSIVNTLNTTNTNVTNAENARVSAENTRVSQENTRVSQESSRVTAESGRVSAESTRVSQENTRQSQETTRQNQEATRQSNETARQTAISNVIHRGPYNSSTSYAVNNSVSYNGSTYRCIQASTGNLPTNPTYWTLEAAAGSVASVTSANSDISVANSTTTPILTLNSGTGANQIVKRNGTGSIDDVVTVDNKIGLLSNLPTTDKTSVVNSITEIAGNPTPTTTSMVYGLQVLNCPKCSLLSNFNVKGRTLVNIPGKDGNCESLTPFTTLGSVTLSTTQKKSGSNSIKMSPSGNVAYAQKDYTYKLDTAKNYVLGVWVFIESWTSGNVDISLRDFDAPNTLRYTASANTTIIGSWQFIYVKIPTSNALVGNGFRLVVGNYSNNTFVAYFDSIRLYEVSASDYNAIGTTYTATSKPSIDDVWPYVDSVQHLNGVYVNKYGKNLLPPFTEWALHANAVVTEPYKLTLNATAAFQSSSIDVPVIGGQTYTLSAGSLGATNGYIDINWKDSSGANISNSARLNYPSTSVAVTAPSNAVTAHVNIGNVSGTGTFTFTNPQLELGSTATSFVPRNDDAIYLQSAAASSVDGTVYDTIYQRDGKWWRQNRFVRGEALTITSNTATLVNNAASTNAVIVDDSNGDIYRLVTTLSGSGKEFTLSGTGNKTVTFNASNNPVTPKITYQLATATVEDITNLVEGAISLHQDGNQIEVGSGVVVREKASPQASSTFYVINQTNALSNLKNRTNRILRVYRNGVEDRKWGLYTNFGGSASANGGGSAVINASDYDPTAVYEVTYIALDTYGMTTNPVTITGDYDSNIKTVQDRLVQKSSDLETKLSVQDAINTSTSNKIGLLSGLTTNSKTDLVSAVNEVKSNTTSNTTNIGTLSSLITTAKSDLVSAVNEVKGNVNTNTTNITSNTNAIGTLSNLTTTAKTDLVSALNESIQYPVNAMSRQALINGNFDIKQRGSSFTNPAVNSYTLDRWRTTYNVLSGTFPANIVHSQQTLNGGEINNSYYFYRINVDGAGSGQYRYQLQQIIENGTRFLCGNNKKITVSFYARSSISGKKIGVFFFQSYGTGGSPTATETINGSNYTLTSSWQKFTLTLTTNTLVGKTFGTNNDDVLYLTFGLAWDAATQATYGASAAETFGGAGNIDIAQVQVNAGDQALPFQPRSFAEELALCMRYYEKSYSYDVAPATASNSAGIESKVVPSNTINATQPYGKVVYKIQKRSTPTVTVYPFATPTNTGRVSTNQGVDLGANSGAVLYSGQTGFTVYNASGGSLTTADSAVIFHWTADAEL
jgi:hypothetical protein